jgi:hypothetical protein
MHMIWLNLIPQLIDLWTGKFNDLDNGLEDYQLEPNVWDALCEACVPSRRTIPTSFGCPIPDPRKRSQFIAETWNGFTTQLGPFSANDSQTNVIISILFALSNCSALLSRLTSHVSRFQKSDKDLLNG